MAGLAGYWTAFDSIVLRGGVIDIEVGVVKRYAEQPALAACLDASNDGNLARCTLGAKLEDAAAVAFADERRDLVKCD